MMRSMYAGVSGLKSHQTKMDVVGNNISNVNTTGYKGSRVNFKEMLSQNLQGAKAPQGEVGGVNPQQIGLGVDVGSINTNTEQGNSQSTGNNTDLSIEGNGYFTVNDGQKNLFTRDGSMSLDEDGSLVNGSTGYKAQGWMADENGNIDTNSDVEDIEIPIGDSMPGKESTEAAFSGNLDGRAIGGDSRSATIDVYDSLGEKHTLDVGYQRKTESSPTASFSGTEDYEFEMDDTSGDLNDVDINFEQDDGVTGDIDGSFDEENKEITLTYDWADNSGSANDKYANDVEDVINDDLLDPAGYDGDPFSLDIDGGGSNDFVMGDFENQAVTLSASAANEWDWTVSDISDAEIAGGDTGTLEFDSDGRIKENTELGTIEFDPEGGAEDGQEVELDFSRLTQSAADFSVDGEKSDGYEMGSLDSFEIDSSGIINGSYSNGLNQALGQVAVSRFSNPSGLSREGDTLFSESQNSGDARIGQAGNGGRGDISAGTLEMSNVDLSDQFSEMITTQRGFQSNSKSITTTDEMLQELVNLKR